MYNLQLVVGVTHCSSNMRRTFRSICTMWVGFNSVGYHNKNAIEIDKEGTLYLMT